MKKIGFIDNFLSEWHANNYPDRGKLLLSQKALADEIGVSMVTVARWESQGLEPQFLTKKKFEAFCEKNGINFSASDNN